MCALFLALYTLGQLALLVQYWRLHRYRPTLPPLTDYPAVTIQLPIYNESDVVEGLLAAVTCLDYPREKLLIQVLDDSSDHTHHITGAQVAYWRDKGWQIQHIQRDTRAGFKAGALANGLGQTSHAFIAIFDADFIPPPDFLQKLLPHLLAKPEMGAIQARWGHLNADENSLTRAQALSIDAHFIIEQTARSRSGWLLSFNGSGGIWRRECIQAAGGWSADTLTEDLDLSYRAQLTGWQVGFAPDVMTAAQLPPQLAAYRQQQTRWAMGSTQCLLKFLSALWSPSKPLRLGQRVMATHHLLQYTPHLIMMALLLLTPPLILSDGLAQVKLANLGLVGLVPPLLYATSQSALYTDWHKRLLAFPLLVLIGTGITWATSRAILRALRGERGVFQRTPKFQGSWQNSHYAIMHGLCWGELLLSLYAAWGISLAIQHHPELTPYLCIYTASFGSVFFWDLWDKYQVKQQAKHISQETISYVD